MPAPDNNKPLDQSSLERRLGLAWRARRVRLRRKQPKQSWIWDAACSIRGAKDAPKYKDYMSEWRDKQAQAQVGKIGLAQQHFNVGAMKNCHMPLPPTDQQDEIMSHFELVDSKHNLATSKRNTLHDLFRTLLHELTTAKTRVHELELPTRGQTV